MHFHFHLTRARRVCGFDCAAATTQNRSAKSRGVFDAAVAVAATNTDTHTLTLHNRVRMKPHRAHCVALANVLPNHRIRNALGRPVPNDFDAVRRPPPRLIGG